MKIEFLDSDHDLARVTRWAFIGWRLRRVTAVLRRHENCSRDRDSRNPFRPAWVVEGFDPQRHWWTGSRRIERARRQARRSPDVGWQPVAGRLPEARLLP